MGLKKNCTLEIGIQLLLGKIHGSLLCLQPIWSLSIGCDLIALFLWVHLLGVVWRAVISADVLHG